MMENKDFGVEDLICSPEVQRFYQIVNGLTGIAIAICYPDGNLAKALCGEEEFNPLCKVIVNTPKGRKRCYATNRLYCKQAAKSRQGLRYYCHAGLVDMAVPVYIEGNHVATINAGQMLTEKKTKKGFDRLCNRLQGIPFDKKDLHNAYKKAAYTPTDKLEKTFELVSFFAQYFCEVGQRLKSFDSNQKHPQIAMAQQYIKKNFNKPLSLNDVSQKVQLSENYFSRLFHKVVGMNFVNYLNSIRIGQAKKLLLTTDWPVIKVAFEAGFNNLPHFNRIFKAQENCCPSKFRRKNITS